MKKLQITLFILASLVFLTQTVRHIHLYFFAAESGVSMIDPFEPDYEIEKEVKEEHSTEILVQEYKQTQKKVEELEEGKTKEEIEDLAESNKDLYSKRSNLRHEIIQREAWNREISNIWIYCFVGITFIILGSIIYAKGAPWIGMSFLIPGFLELIWWSSPSFHLGGAIREYELLLLNKIILSIVGIVLLYALWFFKSKMESESGSKRR